MLDAPDVEKVLFGEAGVAEGLKKANATGRKAVIDFNSIPSLAVKNFAEEINAMCSDYLDARVSGREVHAENTTPSIMVGSAENVLERINSLCGLINKNTTLVGGNGDGRTAKVASQIIVLLTIEPVSEALVFAAKAGANPARVRQALISGFAASKNLEVHG